MDLNWGEQVGEGTGSVRARAWMLAALTSVVLGCLAAPSESVAGGEITQKPGAAGCYSPAGACMPLSPQKKGPQKLALSPDGKHLYLTVDDGVNTLDRNSDGSLEQKPRPGGCTVEATDSEFPSGCAAGRALLNARGVAVSHDGKSLYVTADGSVASFDIASDGSITQKAGLAGCVSEVAGCTTGYGMHGGIGGGALALAPDDSQLLRTDTLDSALALLGRTSDGVLSQSSDGSGCLRMAGTPFCDTARAIASAEDVAISPDGRSVYVTSPAADAVAIFDRDPGGTLTQKPGAAGCISDDGAAGCATGRALGGAGRIAIPADGKSVYITGSEGNSIVIFDRAPNGVLTQRSGTAGCVASTGAGGCAPARALAGATAITISPDQTNLYVSSVTGDSIAVFDRDADGSLTQKDGPAGCVNATGEEGCTKGNLLDGIYDLALSPDGSSLYATAFFANALLVFDRAPDLPDPPDNLPPELKKLKLKPNRFKAAKKGPSVTVKGKPKVSFNLGETATVRFSVERALSGRRAGKRCVKPTRANRAKKHCTRYRKLRGSFTREGTTGANSFRFTGRLAGHSLKPGRYRLTAVATDGTGNRSQPAKVRFSILRRR